MLQAKMQGKTKMKKETGKLLFTWVQSKKQVNLYLPALTNQLNYFHLANNNICNY